MTETW